MTVLIRTGITPFICLILLLGQQASADQLADGRYSLALEDNRGVSHSIGELVLTSAVGVDSSADFSTGELKHSYRLILDHHRFRDHFLSMKELKCLEGPELWCYIPYPYDNPRTLSPTDLRWLEHDLLFLFKRRGEFGADFWNGIYYRLTLVDGEIQGEARALDLNLLASPPDQTLLPPISDADLDEADLLKRWLPKLSIRRSEQP